MRERTTQVQLGDQKKAPKKAPVRRWKSRTRTGRSSGSTSAQSQRECQHEGSRQTTIAKSNHREKTDTERKSIKLREAEQRNHGEMVQR